MRVKLSWRWRRQYRREEAAPVVLDKAALSDHGLPQEDCWQWQLATGEQCEAHPLPDLEDFECKFCGQVKQQIKALHLRTIKHRGAQFEWVRKQPTLPEHELAADRDPS